VVASVAYMDPGNFATNIQAGSRYGYDLLWVVVLANLLAMLFQALSAKLGLVTGRNLAELCRDHLPAPLVWMMWVVSEIAAMATDLAEFLGGAIGLSLMLNLPLLSGMAATAVIVYAMLSLQRFGFRPIELAIGGLVAAIGISYLVEVLIAPIDWAEAARHSVLPQLLNGQALLIAVGIIGATIMPHALYLHSGLTQARIPPRTEAELARMLRASNREVAVALGLAGLVNMAMVLMAAAAFHAGRCDIGEIATACESLTALLGAAAAGTCSRCSPRACRVRLSGRWPGRSSCKVLLASASRCGCGAWPPCRRPVAVPRADCAIIRRMAVPASAVIEPAALPGTTIIPAGTLDDTSWLKPTMEIYCDDAQSWVQLGGGGMQRFPKMHHARG